MVSSLQQVAKILELQPQSFSEYSRLISLGIDWFDLLAVQGTLISLLQHRNLKVSTLWCSAFLMVPLLHLYVCVSVDSALFPGLGTKIQQAMWHSQQECELKPQ